MSQRWPRYTWDARARQYRSESGRFVPRADVVSALHEVLDGAADEMRAEALRLQRGETEIADWQLAMERLIKTAHTAATAIAAGGWAQANSAEWAECGRQLRAQYAYLRSFAVELENGLPLDGRFLNRAAMYAGAAHGTYEAVNYRLQRGSGARWMRRHLHSDHPCADCADYEARGWQPVGTLPLPHQQCQCKANCRCTVEYSQSLSHPDAKPIVPPTPRTIPVQAPPAPVRRPAAKRVPQPVPARPVAKPEPLPPKPAPAPAPRPAPAPPKPVPAPVPKPAPAAPRPAPQPARPAPVPKPEPSPRQAPAPVQRPAPAAPPKPAPPKPPPKPAPPKPAPAPPPKPAPAGELPPAPRFGRSRATVTIRPDFGSEGATVADRLKHASTIVGRPVTAEDLASMVGAPDGATVRLGTIAPGWMEIDFSGPGYNAQRRLLRDGAGRLTLENVLFSVDAKGQGLGRQVFGRQVENAADQGVDHIRTTAGGRKGDTLNGYYTWPRFGYDGPIPQSVERKLPAKLAGSKRVSDLMRTPEGRAWWQANGKTFDGEFDLKDGSLSRTIWTDYLREKEAGAPPSPPRARTVIDRIKLFVGRMAA